MSFVTSYPENLTFVGFFQFKNITILTAADPNRNSKTMTTSMGDVELRTAVNFCVEEDKPSSETL